MRVSLGLRPRAMAVLALGALVWAVLGVGFASLTTHPVVRHVFESTHIEHFAAFYVLSLLAVAGLPMLKAELALGSVATFAVILEVIRMFIPYHQWMAAEDFFCDLTGVAAVLAPMMVDQLRGSFRKNDGDRPTAGGPWGRTVGDP